MKRWGKLADCEETRQQETVLLGNVLQHHHPDHGFPTWGVLPTNWPIYYALCDLGNICAPPQAHTDCSPSSMSIRCHPFDAFWQSILIWKPPPRSVTCKCKCTGWSPCLCELLCSCRFGLLQWCFLFGQYPDLCNNCRGYGGFTSHATPGLIPSCAERFLSPEQLITHSARNRRRHCPGVACTF